jgi:hypothetical protein
MEAIVTEDARAAIVKKADDYHCGDSFSLISYKD